MVYFNSLELNSCL